MQADSNVLNRDPSVICRCAQVVCGGESCPLQTALDQVVTRLGRPIDANDYRELSLVTDQFYDDTEPRFRERYPDPKEQRCKRCRIGLYAEVLRIIKTGRCQPATPAPAAALAP